MVFNASIEKEITNPIIRYRYSPAFRKIHAQPAYNY